MSQDEFEFDQIVIGSGFGGACSALRLSEKGYKVLVIEKGRRWQDDDFPSTNWNLGKFLWVPVLKLFGTWQVTLTRKVIVLHGAGVGGGSLIYANTHLIPTDEVFQSECWSRVRPDWKTTLSPFYSLAQRMLGVTYNQYENAVDHTLRKVAQRMGREQTYRLVNSGVLLPQEGRGGDTVADPYFNGDGPERITCRYCGACMIGCPHNAKNTLTKNYLYFAERNGVEIRPESKVVRIEPLPNAQGIKDGSAGYELTVVKSEAWFFKQSYKIRTRGVVLSGGVIGTVPLLLQSKYLDKTLPGLSERLGHQVRTNSETFMSVSFKNPKPAGQDEIWEGTSITSIFSPDDETNIEPCRFPKGSDSMWLVGLPVPLTENSGEGRWPRPVQLLFNILRHPIKSLGLMQPFGKAKKTVFLMVMQSKESFVHMELDRRWYHLFLRHWSIVQKANDVPLTTYFPVGQQASRLYAEESGGEVGNAVADIVAGTPATAHIMGGVAIGKDVACGVVDGTGAVFGYQNLRVLDGSIIPGNLGVNPSLTILALSEYAMSQIPIWDQAKSSQIKPILFSKPLNGQVSALTGEGNLLNEVNRLNSLKGGSS
ncbi:MAG: GMC oxidoreductase [Beggiatoa sp. IS2]|nr:MAG: GMC oxidoreductase [Beggiatoa sp. IS2]